MFFRFLLSNCFIMLSLIWGFAIIIGDIKESVQNSLQA